MFQNKVRIIYLKRKTGFVSFGERSYYRFNIFLGWISSEGDLKEWSLNPPDSSLLRPC